MQDATIGCAYAQLAVTAQGLATCWVGAFQTDAIARILQAPHDWVPVAPLPVGYATEKPLETGRRDLADLVKWDTL